MYYAPNPYSYPYYAYGNTPMYQSDYMPINHQENVQQVFDAVLAGIKREASAMDLYYRLAHSAPNQLHKNTILQAIEDKKHHLNQFTHLYIALTGTQPMYQIDQVTFQSYQEGLKKAHEAGLEGHEEYHRNGVLAPYPLVQQVFLYVSAGEKEHAERFGFLNKTPIMDYGSQPFVVDIDEITKRNKTYRTALWTGQHLQVTLMSINVGDDIGLEVHPTTDQFIRIEEGQGLVQMGDSKDNLDFQARAYDDYAIMIPAGKWHNIINTGNKPLKVYAIYAPPEHPFGTVHPTKADAMASEEEH